MLPECEPGHRPIRSFVLRQGRMTDGQSQAMERLWPQYGLPYSPAPIDPRAVFGREAPLVFEIGFGAGDALLARAAARPDINFWGVEVHRPGVGSVLMRADAAGLTNLRVSNHDAVDVLAAQVRDASLAELIVEFPDPWHKKRHHKRRLVQAEWLRQVVPKLALGGLLRLATDWQPYAEQMLEVCGAHPQLRNCASSGDYVPRPDSRPVTRFEARGTRLGHAVFDLCFERRS